MYIPLQLEMTLLKVSSLDVDSKISNSKTGINKAFTIKSKNYL